MPYSAIDFQIRPMRTDDFTAVREVCRRAYPNEPPYTEVELAEHHARFPQGQLVAEHRATGGVAGAHFTLRLRMADYHIDDSWDILTAQGSFADDDSLHGHTLYGADLFVSPDYQRHGLGQGLTDATRALVIDERLWRMIGGSRLPGYSKVSATVSAEQYVADVAAGIRTDPVLTVHLKDGWKVVRAVHGYLQHDPESENWAAAMQWINPRCPPPDGFQL
jgi:GNAT superfamily N-acetyltransferase